VEASKLETSAAETALSQACYNSNKKTDILYSGNTHMSWI